MNCRRPLLAAVTAALVLTLAGGLAAPPEVRAQEGGETYDCEEYYKVEVGYVVPVNLAPSRLVLNAVGEAETIQAILPLGGVEHGLPVSTEEFEFALFIDGWFIDSADAVYYCYDDDNLIVDFYRNEVWDALIAEELAGEGVLDAEVFGFFSVPVEGTTDQYIDTCVGGFDQVEVLSPTVGPAPTPGSGDPNAAPGPGPQNSKPQNSR